MRGSVAERFWSKVVRDPDTDCWEWLGSRDRGYGQFAVSHVQRVKAHRWSYERLVGPIPEGLVIDHLCRNPGCVNSEHLEAVTQRENIMRGQGVAAANVQKRLCPRGHEYRTRTVRGKHPQVMRDCRECDRDRKRAEYWAAPETEGR